MSLLPQDNRTTRHTAKTKRNEASHVNASVFGVLSAQEIKSLTLEKQDSVYNLGEGLDT